MVYTLEKHWQINASKKLASILTDFCVFVLFYHILYLGAPKSKQGFNRSKLVQKLSSKDDVREDKRRAFEREVSNKNKEKAAVVIQSCKFKSVMYPRADSS